MRKAPGRHWVSRQMGIPIRINLCHCYIQHTKGLQDAFHAIPIAQISNFDWLTATSMNRFEAMAIKLRSNVFRICVCVISMRISDVTVRDSNSLCLQEDKLPERWNRAVIWHGAFSPVKKTEYKKNWGSFVESWSWLAFLTCTPIEKDTDREFLPQHILSGHISYSTSANFVFIYMQLEQFIWHILNDDKRTLHFSSKPICKNFLLTRLCQGMSYRFILTIFTTKGLRYSWWSDWLYGTLRLTLHQVHCLAKQGKTQLSQSIE